MHALSRLFHSLTLLAFVFLTVACSQGNGSFRRTSQEAIDLVDPLIGSLSLGEKPLPAIVQLPHALLAISPMKEDFRSNYIEGLPLVSIPSLGEAQFYFCPLINNSLPAYHKLRYTYDHEEIAPYRYHVYLDKEQLFCNFSLQERSGIYHLDFSDAVDKERILLFRSSSEKAVYRIDSLNKIYATYPLKGKGNLYMYLECNLPITVLSEASESEELLVKAPSESKELVIRYGISLIDHQQAHKNLQREIPSYEYNVVAKAARNTWSTALDHIKIEGGTMEEQAIFYTALYRSLTAPVCISEYGRYYSPIDDSAHNDEGIPFYTNDYTAESFRSLHPLKTLLFPEIEQHILNSYIRMAQANAQKTLPAYPSFGGDIASPQDANRTLELFTDAYSKGLTDIDLQTVYQAATHYVKSGKADAYDNWCYKKIATFSGHPIKQLKAKEGSAISIPSISLIYQLEPYNIREMIALAGSVETFEKLLDERMTSVLLEPLTVHNMYGYYLYSFTDHPFKSQKIIRHVLQKNCRLDPAGFPTAVDGASWGASVVFSMLGFYPVTPGEDEYIIGSPIFNKATLDQGGGRYFVLEAEKASEREKYVGTVLLNERPLKHLSFPHINIAQGGSLKMKMHAQPYVH